jgi:hypothetical protein
VNNAFIRKSTTNYTLDSVKGSPYTLSSDGRTVEDHASIENESFSRAGTKKYRFQYKSMRTGLTLLTSYFSF